MSEPTEPDSQPETEPDVELDAKPETEVASEDETTIEPDAAPETDVDVATAPAASPAFSTRQAIVIAAALVVALALTIGLMLILRSDDKAKPVSPEDQAKSAAAAVFRGLFKLSQADPSGCQDLADNLALTADQASSLDKCVEETAAKTPPTDSVTLVAINPTQVTLDDAAGTGTVNLDIVTSQNGKEQTQPTPVPVVKVEGRWKVSPS